MTRMRCFCRGPPCWPSRVVPCMCLGAEPPKTPSSEPRIVAIRVISLGDSKSAADPIEVTVRGF